MVLNLYDTRFCPARNCSTAFLYRFALSSVLVLALNFHFLLIFVNADEVDDADDIDIVAGDSGAAVLPGVAGFTYSACECLTNKNACNCG